MEHAAAMPNHPSQVKQTQISVVKFQNCLPCGWIQWCKNISSKCQSYQCMVTLICHSHKTWMEKIQRSAAHWVLSGPKVLVPCYDGQHWLSVILLLDSTISLFHKCFHHHYPFHKSILPTTVHVSWFLHVQFLSQNY